MDRRLYQLLTCLLFIQTCYAYQMYQERIPNGASVPHPCMANNFWRAVGHLNLLGGGDRNPFGEDFKNSVGVWDEAICRKDSDGDGKTNGEELGDPECIWFIGQEPSVRVGLSHPGVCEPMSDVDKCGPVPDWINCKGKDFVCQALSEPETINFTIRIPPTPVPAQKTTYTCMYFELPNDQEYHLVANTPHIDNEAVMHHSVVVACADVVPDEPLNTPHVCHDMKLGSGNCEEYVASWGIGREGTCLPHDVGFLINTKYARLQLHWTNPELRSGMTDSSGMNLYLSPKLRKYNEGKLVLGQIHLIIPPAELSTVYTGVCSSKSTSQDVVGPVNVTSVRHHMHTLGVSQSTQLRRAGGEVETLFDEKEYFYDQQNTYYLENPIVLRPGDEILTTCEYKSTSRTKTTYFGGSSTNEMCFSFLTYYPKENIKQETIFSCSQWGNIDMREVDIGVMQGCSALRTVFNDPGDEAVRNIREKCAISHCRKECKEYIRVLKSTDPCYQGDAYKVKKFNALKNPYDGGVTLSLEELQYISRADSCDTEIAMENIILVMGRETAGASGVMTSVLACFIGLFLKLVV